MIDRAIFTVDALLDMMLDDRHGNIDAWRRLAEIIPDYVGPSDGMLPVPAPKCVVRVGDQFLRFSKGPCQGYFWDLYGDDFGSASRALWALVHAPVPPHLLKSAVWKVPAPKSA